MTDQAAGREAFRVQLGSCTVMGAPMPARARAGIADALDLLEVGSSAGVKLSPAASAAHDRHALRLPHGGPRYGAGVTGDQTHFSSRADVSPPYSPQCRPG